MYIEYVFEFRPDNSSDLSEREGIYIGALTKGIPQGYGIFYYERKKNVDGKKTYMRSMILGEWENGNLKKGSTVENRLILHIEKSEDNIFDLKYTFNDIWGNEWFIHDEAEGTYSCKYIAIPEGKNWMDFTFEGKVEVNGISDIRGVKKYQDGTCYYGEFRDGKLYNGAYYNADGSVGCSVKNGEWEKR